MVRQQTKQIESDSTSNFVDKDHATVRLEITPQVLENARLYLLDLVDGIKEIQKKGVNFENASLDGMPENFHKHLRFSRICLDVLEEDVADFLVKSMEKKADEEDRK